MTFYFSLFEIDLLHPYFTQVTLYQLLFKIFHVHSFHRKNIYYLSSDADNVVEGVRVICEECVELIRVHVACPG